MYGTSPKLQCHHLKLTSDCVRLPSREGSPQPSRTALCSRHLSTKRPFLPAHSPVLTGPTGAAGAPSRTKPPPVCFTVKLRDLKRATQGGRCSPAKVEAESPCCDHSSSRSKAPYAKASLLKRTSLIYRKNFWNSRHLYWSSSLPVLPGRGSAKRS